jgi:UDP-N-acetylglucosamine 2-epimerase (non-hydrolysing)
MIDSLHYAKDHAMSSNVRASIGLGDEPYALVTLHRPSNVDDKQQLSMLIDVVNQIARSMHVVFPVHPRTRKHIAEWGLDEAMQPNVRLIDPAGYIDFLGLMMHARFVLTDSGGIQEETTALRVPCITARTTTERPVTVTEGTNVLVEPAKEAILGAVSTVMSGTMRPGTVPALWDGHAAERIAAIISAQCL